MKTLLLSGVSGFIGQRVIAMTKGKYELRRLVRGQVEAVPGVRDFQWDPAAGKIDSAALEDVDAALCLNGASLFTPWTRSNKELLYRSRIDSVSTLANALGPATFISGSAVGYYGFDNGDTVLDEDSAPGTGFLAELCQDWEAAAGAAPGRKVQLRTGLVMGNGGLLGIAQHPYRMGLGARLGSGRQWMATISLTDYVRAILFLIENDVSGPVNMVGPNPQTNASWHADLSTHLNRPGLLAVPALPGQMMKETAFASQRAIPKKLSQAGFEFQARTNSEMFAQEIPVA